MRRPAGQPAVVFWSAAFFAAAGTLEIGLAVLAGPPVFWRVWEALGRGSLGLVIAAGLWRRLALCRSVAMVYCIASVLTYISVLVLAFLHAPFAFTRAIVVQSLFEIPSCSLLYPALRAREASAAFPRPLFGAHAMPPRS